ncbi:MAG: lipoyl(octanoyl) transferase LipB, partial [Deltaproteobacteria bacterium]|nr:lipoyl(octanoyl) transferase LipB [Deltaproteobacteria bacterium]
KNDIREGSAVEYLLFLEHPNVITRGYSERGADAGLISSREEIAAAGFELVQTDRGGKTTLHNPGQLVGYTIFDLKRNNYRIKTFVQMIEETLMDTLATFDLTGERRKNDPGLYVEGKKIAFLGLNVDGPVTTHGFSINVRNDLRPFGHIVPCGQPQPSDYVDFGISRRHRVGVRRLLALHRLFRKNAPARRLRRSARRRCSSRRC